MLTALQCLWLRPDAGARRAGVPGRDAGHARSTRSTTPSRARSCTRRAAARWRPRARCRSRRYYGSVDATPLFVVLAAAYWRRTGDLEFIRSHLAEHHSRRCSGSTATAIIDGDGFVEYARAQRRRPDPAGLEGFARLGVPRRRPHGRRRRSRCARCRATSTRPSCGAAELARELGEHALADRWHDEAEALKRQLPARFWCEELGSYALALDGDKQPCEVASSNAGHALWSRHCGARACARASSQRLLEPDCSRGWGVRTMGSRPGALQPDVVSQRLDLAARQRADRRRPGALRPRRMRDAAARRRVRRAACTSTAAACPSCSAASRAAPARARRSTRWPARRRPGPPRPCSACWPAAWAWSSRPRSAACACARRGCRRSSTGCASKAWRVGDARVDLLLQRYRDSVGVDVTRRDGDIEVAVVV